MIGIETKTIPATNTRPRRVCAFNHTPGPWHLVETEPGIDAEMDVFVTVPRYAGGTALVARVMHADDALVIAAAPELLAALQAADKWVAMYHTLPGHEAASENMSRVIRAAIAQATGANDA